LILKKEKNYCKFARGDSYVCPYQPEETTISFCMCCKLREISSQQNLLIKQNKIMIILLKQIRDQMKNVVISRGPSYPILEKIEQ